MSLAEALEAAASSLPDDADAIRPANGDPFSLLAALGPEARTRVLAWLLAERPGEAEELAEAWAGQPEGVEALLAVPEAGLPKAGRKALRRLQHQLRSRGVAVERARPGPTVAKLPEVADQLEGACLSPIDPLGVRVAWLMEPHPQGGARIFEIVFDDGRGVVALEVYSASRRGARSFFRELSHRDRMPALEVTPDVLRAVVAHAATAQPKDRPAPRAFAEWRRTLAEPAPGTRLPGEEVEAALGPAEPERVHDAVKLVEQGRVGPWPPDRSVLTALVERLRNAAESPLVVSPAAKREQLDGLLADATADIFDAAGRTLAAHRFRESAFAFWRHGDEEAARACLAAAAAFLDEERDPRDLPVARALVEIPLRPVLESLRGEGGGTAGEPGPLVTP